MSRWRLGCYRNKRGKLSTVYVSPDGNPIPSQKDRVGDRPILHHGLFTDMPYREARKQLIAEAEEKLGEPQDEEKKPRSMVEKPQAKARKASSKGPKTRTKPKTKIKRSKKNASPSAREWAQHLDQYARSIKFSGRKKHGKDVALAKSIRLKMAGLLAFVGTVEDQTAKQVRNGLVQLFFSPARLMRSGITVSQIPVDRGQLIRLAENVEAYNKIVAKDSDGLRKERFSPSQVTEIMLQVPDATAYVKHCQKGGLERARAIWHPNTLKVAKQRLRGVFGPLPNQSEEDDDEQDQIRIVRD